MYDRGRGGKGEGEGEGEGESESEGQDEQEGVREERIFNFLNNLLYRLMLGSFDSVVVALPIPHSPIVWLAYNNVDYNLRKYLCNPHSSIPM